MPASANYKRPAATLLLLLGLAMSNTLAAAGIQVREVSTGEMYGQITLSARLDLELSEEALRALEHGVALDIVIEMQALEDRRWLWDRTIAQHSERFKLERQALSKHYLVTDNYSRRSFISLQEALRYIGTIRNYPLVRKADLEPDNSYYGRLRAWLDIESLPAPMRPTAYISSNWQLASNWYKWQIGT